MIGTLEHNLRALAAGGVRMSIWPTQCGRFQANVSNAGDKSWTCETDDDPLRALSTALRYRLAGVSGRTTLRDPRPEVIEVEQVQAEDAPDDQQIDIEDAIAAAVARDHDEDLIG